jgi:hypothetical protein
MQTVYGEANDGKCALHRRKATMRASLAMRLRFAVSADIILLQAELISANRENSARQM